MISSNLPLVLALATILASLGHLTLSFYRNLEACRKSGIPYIAIPFNPHSIPARLLYPIWRPILSTLPSSMKGAWYTFMQPAIFWDELYAPFRQVGSDTVLTCSPMCVTLHTAAADTIRQVTERRNDFPKPTHIYQIIDIFGKSTISVEGHLWKKHRKGISGILNEKVNHAVWSESVYQIQQMLSQEVPESQSSSSSIEDIEGLCSRAALAIISKASYGVRIGLGGSSNDPGAQNDWVEGKTNGHKLSYADAILSISEDVTWLFMFRRSLLKYFPFKSARRASQAYIDWGQYMREMIVAKRDQIDDTLDSKPKQRNTDLLSNLVESARGVQDFVEDQSTGSGKIGLDGFSDDEIMGNAFLVIMAGHETTAGTLHIALLLLAMNVGSQRRLQNEVDSLFGGRNPSDWNYDHDFSSASNGMLGAVVSETLRWMPPVSAIPKWTPEEQPLNVNGVGCTVPKNTMIALNVPAAHRNPNQWPHGKPGRPHDLEYAPSNPDDDLGEFLPERWLPSSSNNAGSYRPERGAYLPFSEGSRICIGRRFTQVEMVALLAVIFQSYSVELAVDEWANDAEVERMDEDLRHEVWSKARASSKWKLRTKMTFLMTNRMNNEHVPLRFVRRGKERFAAEQW